VREAASKLVTEVTDPLQIAYRFEPVKRSSGYKSSSQQQAQGKVPFTGEFPFDLSWSDSNPQDAVY